MPTYELSLVLRQMSRVIRLTTKKYHQFLITSTHNQLYIYFPFVWPTAGSRVHPETHRREDPRQRRHHSQAGESGHPAAALQDQRTRIRPSNRFVFFAAIRRSDHFAARNQGGIRPGHRYHSAAFLQGGTTGARRVYAERGASGAGLSQGGAANGGDRQAKRKTEIQSEERTGLLSVPEVRSSRRAMVAMDLVVSV